MQLKMYLKALIYGMAQTISTSIVEKKVIIPSGIAKSSIIRSMKYFASYCQTSDFGWSNTMLMDIDLMESPQCCISITERTMVLLETTMNISTINSISMLLLILQWLTSLHAWSIHKLFWLLKMSLASLDSAGSSSREESVLDSGWLWLFQICG